MVVSSSAWPVERCAGPNCGARIIWARTEKGKMQPFDAEPNGKGNRRFEDRGEEWKGQRIPTAVPAIAGETNLFGEEVAIYMPHHAYCPDREMF